MTHWTEAYVGKPYVANGRAPEGFDCWGLVCLIYRDQLGINLPTYGAVDAKDLLNVARSLDEGRMGLWQKVDQPRAFDVVGMYGRAEGARRVVHVGVMVDDRLLIHAQGKTHCAVERVDSPLIRSRVDGFWRYANGAEVV